jgi:hypothetical protein
VQGLKPGAYFFRREQNTLELLKAGEFRAEAYHLGLEQELPARVFGGFCSFPSALSLALAPPTLLGRRSRHCHVINCHSAQSRVIAEATGESVVVLIDR